MNWRTVFALAVSLALANGVQASDLEVWIDVDGSAYLHNTTAGPLSFTAYTLSSNANKLDPVGWKSIADQVVEDPATITNQLGSSALAFGEVSPTPANLSELTVSQPGATLQAFAKFAIGKPFVGAGEWAGVTGNFLPAGSVNPVPMQVGLPEPSTWLLATLAGIGLLAFRARGLRVTALQPQ